MSLDGFIADKNNKLEWLEMVPNPNGDDMGYPSFMANVDALVMGRTTFEMVLGFDVDWPYHKPVYVLSTTLKEVPAALREKVFIVNGTLFQVLKTIHGNGHYQLYIDGGRTIQSFLKEDLIDELILTRLPILLGGGSSLFGDLPNQLEFELRESKTILNQIVQCHYIRKR